MAAIALAGGATAPPATSPAALAGALALALSPVLLAQRAGLDPLDAWQVAALRSTSPRALWDIARQGGKSSIASVLAVHRVLYAPGSLVLLISPSERQSKEIFRKAMDVYAATGRAVPAASETKLWLELANGSRLIALPGSEPTTRGFSAPALIVVDEASRVPDELFEALVPMLAVSRGRMVTLSTPAGRRGWWHRLWDEGGPDWEKVLVRADQLPRIDPAWLRAQRASMPDAWFRQEFCGEFLEVDDAAFRYDDVHGALDPSVRPLFPLEEFP